MRKLLAFGHRKRVGKDEACKHLTSKYPNSVTLSFADHIYRIHDYILKSLETAGVSVQKNRDLLRAIGSWGRAINPKVWIILLEKRIKEITDADPDTSIFVSDLRTPDEAEMLISLGFSLVKINRKGVEKDLDFTEVALSGFEEFERVNSEGITFRGKWDFKIYNNSTLEEFHQRVEEVANGLSLSR